MRDILEFTKNDIRELGLLPLKHFRDIVLISQYDCVIHFSYSHKYIMKYDGKEDIISPNFLIKKTDFLDMDEEFFKELNFSDLMIKKYLWLQKYIKGEVSGKFEKEREEIVIAVRNACEKKDNEIENLRRRVADLKSENEIIKEENKQLKLKVKNIEKIKKLKEIISQIEL